MAMRCLGCEYVLDGLGAGPCPECGRVFDPAEPRSYASGRALDPAVRRQVRIARLLGFVPAVWPLLMLGIVHLMLVIARIELGRWPHRGGADDPKGIALVGRMYDASFVVFDFGTPAVVLLGFVVLAWMMRLQRPVAIRFTRQVIVLWAVAVVLLIWDPARAFEWFMD